MILYGALIALLFLGQPGETRDAACEARSRRGLPPGTQFKIEATCQICACDGANRLFCTSDSKCQDRKQEEYNSRHRRPCMMDGSVFKDLAKVQRDCNICTCRNETWICTEERCNNVRGRPVSSINSGSNERDRTRNDEREKNPERTRQDERERNPERTRQEQSTNRGSSSEDQREKKISTGDSTSTKSRKQSNTHRAAAMKCVDTDTRCSGIISRRGQDICNTNPVVLKRCPESCGKCKCKDSDARCGDWIRRKGQGVCTTSRYVGRMCDESCGKCQTEEEEEVVCEDMDANCAVWAKRVNVCQRYKYMEKKCQLSCGFCTPPPGVQEEEEEERAREEEEKEEEENRTDMEKSYIEEWKADLVAKGLLGDTHKPNGCLFRCEGRVYPWGSQFQGDCGICTCRLRKGTLNDYYFRCSSPTCGEIAPNCEG